MRIHENIIEFSPLSLKGQKALSRLIKVMREHQIDEQIIKNIYNEDYFLNEYYVQPFTRIIETNWSNDTNSPEDQDVYDIEVLKRSQQVFESGLTDGTTKLIWLHGNAGCGKSTYVHKLSQIYKDQVKMSFYDFEKAKKACIIKRLASNKTDSVRLGNDQLWTRSNLFRFLILLIDQIVDNLYLNNLYEDNNENALKSIVHEYERLCDPATDFEDVIELFSYLKKMICRDTYAEGIENTINFFQGIINSFISSENDTEDNTKNQNIITLLRILLHILLYKGNIEGKSHICVFDNIEYMSSLEYDPDKVLITDRAIEIILNSVHSAVELCLPDAVRSEYHHVPKIIVVTRKATVAFDTNLEMAEYQSLEITNWFCAKEIYEKRLKFIEPFIKEEELTAYKVFNIIMDDCTMSKWSLVPFLSRLFNYNIRRMARILIHILIMNTASSTYEGKETLDNFISSWRNNQDNFNSQLKHFFRMYIIRLVLDSFNGYPREIGDSQNIAYFNKLMVELGEIEDYKPLSIPQNGEDLLMFCAKKDGSKINDKKEQKRIINQYVSSKMDAIVNKKETSFTRRLLTILHRVDIDNEYTDLNISAVGIRYFDFEDLLKNLLLDGNTSSASLIKEDTISKLSDILFLLNEVTDSTGWVPLTSVKWNNREEKYTKNAIYKLLKRALSNLREHKVEHSYGIRITYAGQTFLKLMPEFEYFAARFCPLDHKLISNKSLSKDRNGSFACIETINKVLFYSIKCSYTVIKRAEIEYSSLGENATIDYDRMFNSRSLYKETHDSSVVTHPMRIFAQHINYLQCFKVYIESLEPSAERFKTGEEKQELLDALNSKIGEYNAWSTYFSEKYLNFLVRENI